MISTPINARVAVANLLTATRKARLTYDDHELMTRSADLLTRYIDNSERVEDALAKATPAEQPATNKETT